jgi:hypothetical protein
VSDADRFEVTQLPDLPETHDRGLAFLECPTRRDINAKGVFDRLRDKTKQDVLNRFDYWLDGGVCDKYFHGFPNHPTYNQCYVFKWKHAGAHHRLYGFLTNPRPRTQKAFRACVLVSHAQKNTANTDPSELAHAESLRLNVAVIAAVKKAFPERN